MPVKKKDTVRKTEHMLRRVVVMTSYYTIIDFNEVDIRIYLPESDNSPRPLGRGEYHF